VIDGQIINALADFPENDFVGICGAVSFWHRERHKILAKYFPEAFWKLWERLWKSAKEVESQPSKARGLLEVAINRIAGRLTEILIDECHARKLEKGSGLPKSLIDNFNMLIAEQSYNGILARVVLARSIVYLHYIAPEWTVKSLVPFFEWTNPEAKHMWEAYVFTQYIADPLFFRELKSSYFVAITREEVEPSALVHLSEHLMLMLIEIQLGNRWPISTAEAKSSLRSGGDQFRDHAAWFLWRWFVGQKESDRTSMWKKVVRPILAHSWPRDRDCLSTKVANHFARMSLENTKNFNDAINDIKPFMVRAAQGDALIVHQMSGEKYEFVKSNAPTALKLISYLTDTSADRAAYGLRDLLNKLSEADPKLKNNPDWKELDAFCLKLGN
jgi:hypothetical protein